VGAGVGVSLCGLATDNIAMFNWGLQKYNDVFLNQLTPQVTGCMGTYTR
jgi:hypothetical protein